MTKNSNFLTEAFTSLKKEWVKKLKAIALEMNTKATCSELPAEMIVTDSPWDKESWLKLYFYFKGRVRLLLDKNHKCYRARRTGERRRKSIRGCIVGHDIQVLSLSISKKGDNEIPGLTDKDVPRCLGPKRANKIRKLFALKKTDDIALVKKSVVRRRFTSKSGKER